MIFENNKGLISKYIKMQIVSGDKTLVENKKLTFF